MMITQFMTTKQLGNLSRQRMRNIERKYRKKLRSLQRRIERADLPVRFNNTTVTAFGNFGLFQAFKEAIDFRGMLGQIHLKRHHNCLYTNVALLDTTIDALTLGLLRFSHMNGLRTDPGYQKIKETTQIADESTLREILAVICEQKALDRLAEINRTLLSLKARTDEPREVWLDIDDSVLTVFGNQEGAKKGYNPRYHGRLSYKVKVAFISGTCELVNARLYSGNVASNGQFMEFLKETLDILAAQNIIVKGIRMDKGFFAQDTFTYLEEQCIEYICKAKLTGTMRKVINYLDEEEQWEPVSKNYATAEITIPLPTWPKARRFVFVRETEKPEIIDGQLCFDIETYDYEIIVTSKDDLTAEKVWHEYNKRCNIENKIDELKVGLGFDKMSQSKMGKNIAFMWLKVIAYNLLNWFRLALFEDKESRYEVPTIRCKILNVPGNIVGNNRYRHVRLAPNPWLEKILRVAKENLAVFFSYQAWLAVDTS